MKKIVSLGVVVALFAWSATGFFAAAWERPLCTGLQGPEGVCYSPRGVMYAVESGTLGTAGDGRVSIVENGAARSLVAGLDDPQAIVVYDHQLYATDRTKIIRIDPSGETSDFLTAERFPAPPQRLTGLAVDRTTGLFLVADAGDSGSGGGAAVYRFDAHSLKVDVVADRTTIPELRSCSAVVFEGAQAALVADSAAGTLHRIRLDDRAAVKIADGLPGIDGIVWDHFGRLFVSSSSTGKVFGIARPGAAPIEIDTQLQAPIVACLESDGSRLVVADRKAGTLTTLPTVVPGLEVDERPLAAVMRPAFTKLMWTGWQVDEESGRLPSLRPICLTHAGDGSHRLFVATQQGVVHSFPDDDSATETKLFLDISDRVRYSDLAVEEGLLGLAFHPQFRDNGELFVFYTDRRAAMANVVSRFRVRSDDPSVADPLSEEEVLRIEKPNDYHNGGAIAFGPDGYLYISLGDGGPQGDPEGNAQNLAMPLGKVLRIDVDRHDEDKRYGIPADNPLVGRSDALGEIWCYGLRNTWRMAFDRKTGRLWGGDVGQGFYEEVNILEAGKNYGWSRREGLHPFGPEGCGPSDDLTDPVWEYSHALGPSITGGAVYRGNAIPELDGAYIYGDYVSNRIWALRYDDELLRVTSNQPLGPSGVPIMSFGEDERGELYVLGVTNTGRGIYKMVPGQTP